MVQDQLVKDLGIPDVLQPRHGSRLLIITHETIGPKMTGPGIRAWEMACALAEQFDVILAAPGNPVRSHPGLLVVGYETDKSDYPSLEPYIVSADVILAMGPLFAQMPRLRELSKPVIVDLYDPFELEKLAQSLTIEEQYHLGTDLESVTSLRLEGAVGDFFICANERQRDLWLGALLAAGRVNTVTYAQDPTLRTLIDVVPFGVPSQSPRKQHSVLKGIYPGIDSDDKVLLWNGGLWQWLDPLTLIDALAQALHVRNDIKLFFAAGKHFNSATVPEMPIYAQTIANCRTLGLLDSHVFFGDWTPYDKRGDYLLEADLGVSLHHPTLESRFASRTRLLDCIWAGLPVVATHGDMLSDMIAERGLGCVVPPNRPDLLAQAILDMLADDSLRDRVNAAAQAVHSELTWTRSVEPIATFLKRAAFAPDAFESTRRAAQARKAIEHIQRQSVQIQHLEQQIASSQEYITILEHNNRKMSDHIEAIKQGRVMRLMRAIDRLLGRE